MAATITSAAATGNDAPLIGDHYPVSGTPTGSSGNDTLFGNERRRRPARRQSHRYRTDRQRQRTRRLPRRRGHGHRIELRASSGGAVGPEPRSILKAVLSPARRSSRRARPRSARSARRPCAGTRARTRTPSAVSVRSRSPAMSCSSASRPPSAKGSSRSTGCRRRANSSLDPLAQVVDPLAGHRADEHAVGVAEAQLRAALGIERVGLVEDQQARALAGADLLEHRRRRRAASPASRPRRRTRRRRAGSGRRAASPRASRRRRRRAGAGACG